MIEYNVKVDEDGTFWYNKDGELHRLDPAIEWPDTYKAYWVDGEYLTEEEFKHMEVK